MPELTEIRWEVRGNGVYPGKVQHGCLTQTFKDGPLDRVYIVPTENEARKEVDNYVRRGIDARYVTRTIPEWDEQMHYPMLGVDE